MLSGSAIDFYQQALWIVFPAWRSASRCSRSTCSATAARLARPQDQDRRAASRRPLFACHRVLVSSAIDTPRHHDARTAFRAAMRESIGVPSMVLAAGYLGFGALASGSQFPLWAALLSTVTIFALPGQLAMLEMSIAGSAAVMIVITVSLTAARFVNTSRADAASPRPNRWRIGAAVHLLAMTGWTASMRRCPGLPPGERLPWFVGFALTNWVCCLVATAVGYALADSLPPLVRQGLVFVGPLYFVLILTGETRTRHGVLALACGAVAGPLIHLASPQWSVMLGGLMAVPWPGAQPVDARLSCAPHRRLRLGTYLCAVW
jgi:predicted branched-subunit amino acid permease